MGAVQSKPLSIDTDVACLNVYRDATARSIMTDKHYEGAISRSRLFIFRANIDSYVIILVVVFTVINLWEPFVDLGHHL